MQISLWDLASRELLREDDRGNVSQSWREEFWSLPTEIAIKNCISKVTADWFWHYRWGNNCNCSPCEISERLSLTRIAFLVTKIWSYASTVSISVMMTVRITASPCQWQQQALFSPTLTHKKWVRVGEKSACDFSSPSCNNPQDSRARLLHDKTDLFI